MGAAPLEPNEWSPEGPERSGGAVRLDDSFGGGDSRATRMTVKSRTFGDWQRYRSTFHEAIGLLAMSEHLPGVTITVQLAVSNEERRTAERSSPGRTREFIMSSDLLWTRLRLSDQAAR
jgi:hypothetical protein